MEIKKQVYTRKYNNDTDKYETIGGQCIEMQFTVFETFTICKMRIFDENNNIILTVDLNTTPDQVITCLPTRLATTISKTRRKHFKHAEEMGRFHFFTTTKWGSPEKKLWDNGEINKFKKDLDNKQIDLEELIAEKKAG